MLQEKLEDEGESLLKRVKLGLSEVEVSPICIGTWQLGQTYRRSKGLPRSCKITDWDVEEASKVLKRAEELGVNFIDTAESYGSEEIIPSIIDVNKWVVATKVSAQHLSYDSVLKAFQRSKERLGKIDLYYIHYPEFTIPLYETFSALGIIKVQNPNILFGISNFATVENLNEVFDLSQEMSLPLVAQQEGFNPLWYTREKFIHNSYGVTFVGYSSLYQGLFSGKYNSSNVPNDTRTRYWGYKLLAQGKLNGLMETIGDVSKVTGVPFSQVVLCWDIMRGSIPIVAPRTVAQLEDIVKTVEFLISTGGDFSSQYIHVIDGAVLDILELKDPPFDLQAGFDETDGAMKAPLDVQKKSKGDIEEWVQ